ncbi:MAG: LuxR C-terminal-related transcriptional regulator [Planctomycetota bacterium]|nr:LuxR C-terminal-related transcriptional regulator [Planctomycetota bacterium]
MLISHGPLTRMGVVSDRGRFLWTNEPMLMIVGGTIEQPSGTLTDALGETMAVERAVRHPRVIDQRCQDAFYELLGGVRHLTRLLPIDEADFGSRGVLVVAVPAVHPRLTSEGSSVPTLATASWGGLERLSNRELDVLRLMAIKACTKAVAATLDRSVKTIENQIQAIHDKLAISMRGELVRIAVQAGLHAFEEDEWRALIASRAVA